MVYIITKTGGSNYGRNRSEVEENLAKDGLRTMDDESLDKCKYLERKSKETLGHEVFVNKDLIGKTERITE